MPTVVSISWEERPAWIFVTSGPAAWIEVWFESDDIRRTRAARLVSFIKDLLDAMGNVLAFSRGQEPFIGIDDIRSFIDLAEPVKVVSGCLVSSKNDRAGHQRAERERHQ